MDNVHPHAKKGKHNTENLVQLSLFSTRACNKCNTEKPLDLDHFERSGKTGFRSTCKKCRKETQLARQSRGISLICPTCQKTFHRTAGYIQYTQEQGQKDLYCSRSCGHSYHTKIQNDKYQEIVSAYLSGETALHIAKRYDVSEMTILKVLKKQNIPSRTSQDYIKLGINPHPTKGKGHTEEAKQKIREATLKQFSTQEARDLAASKQSKAIADGKFATVSRKEKMVESVLLSLSIAYKPQSPIRDPQTNRYCACVDFELENKVVIEVNGTFWHSDPRFYPDGPIHHSQKHADKAYAKKMEALKRLGYQVVEIWEYDIDQDVYVAVIEALRKVGINV